MKTKFDINEEIFGRGESLEEMYRHYERDYKKYGFILDKQNEDVYKIVDREINANKGDAVYFYGIWEVEFKAIDVLEDLIIYSLKMP